MTTKAVASCAVDWFERLGVAVFLATPLKRRVKVDWDIFDDEHLAREWLRTGEAQYRRSADPMNMKG